MGNKPAASYRENHEIGEIAFLVGDVSYYRKQLLQLDVQEFGGVHPILEKSTAVHGALVLDKDMTTVYAYALIDLEPRKFDGALYMYDVARNSAVRKTAGHGMGLAAVKALVRKWGEEHDLLTRVDLDDPRGESNLKLACATYQKAGFFTPPPRKESMRDPTQETTFWRSKGKLG